MLYITKAAEEIHSVKVVATFTSFLAARPDRVERA
jgi:hypothetical protein